MRPRLVDSETLRGQVLRAGKACASEGIYMTVKELRSRGVTGNEARIYRVRKELVDASLLPGDLIRTHTTHRPPVKHTSPDPGQNPEKPDRGLTWECIRLYGGRRRLRREFARDESGASIVEYGLLIALIALVCIAAITLLGTTVSGLLTSIAGKI